MLVNARSTRNVSLGYSEGLSVNVPVVFDTTIGADQPLGRYGAKFTPPEPGVGVGVGVGVELPITVIVFVYELSPSLVSETAPAESRTIRSVCVPAASV